MDTGYLGGILRLGLTHSDHSSSVRPTGDRCARFFDTARHGLHGTHVLSGTSGRTFSAFWMQTALKER